ncbi:MAG TPA: hypothetical protein VL463_12620 [Kofleriaceae bacterium]|jgi:hypothetical protein|nr:hypothetical protein [Kofleriaceae bacterium]
MRSVLAISLAACASGGAHGTRDPIDAAPIAIDADLRPPPPQPDPIDGPAAHLLIDDSIHTGGVWGAPMDFHMSDYPLGWAIATVHASMLLRDECIQIGPNAVLAVAMKESRLQCAIAGSSSQGDGCFQIEDGSAYVELGRIFPGRFTATHADVIGGDHFETSAIAMAHYYVFATAMFRKYAACPEAFFVAHPDPRTPQKVLTGAYNRGLWWSALPAIFTTCADHDVISCFDSDVARDYTGAIVDYTRALDATPAFDAPVAWTDLAAYWARIEPLYPEVSDDVALGTLRAAFDDARAGADTVSFRTAIRPILRALIATLPPMATVDQAATGACAQSYLMGAACDVGAACVDHDRCPRDDGTIP